MVTLVAAGGCLAVAHWLDPWAYQHLAWPAAGDRDWGRLLRILGFIPTWAAVAGLLWAESRSGKPNATALAVSAKSLVVAVILGGVISELLKMLVRRERPNVTAGLYHFRPFDDQPFNTGKLGMPSGHTMVAFAGAGTLARRYPKMAPLLLALAAGCGLTRVFAQAHFLSDTVAGAFGGGWIGMTVATRLGRAKPAP